MPVEKTADFCGKIGESGGPAACWKVDLAGKEPDNRPVSCSEQHKAEDDGTGLPADPSHDTMEITVQPD